MWNHPDHPTRRGDAGETRARTRDPLSKDDPRVTAYGTLYELNAFLGLARAALTARPIQLPRWLVASDFPRARSSTLTELNARIKSTTMSGSSATGINRSIVYRCRIANMS